MNLDWVFTGPGGGCVACCSSDPPRHYPGCEARALVARVEELEAALRGVRAHLQELKWRDLPDVKLALARIDDVIA
jgi:hypothetical protein